MMDPSNPLGEMMQQAVNMKSAAQGKLRTNFDSWPPYYQNSLFMQESVTSLRDTDDFEKKYDGAHEFKLKGNEYFKKGEFDEANAQYEKSIAVFKYIRTTDPNWRNKGIKDESLEQIEYKCQNEHDQDRLNQLLVSCYLNIAMCKFKMKEYRLCFFPCDDALKIDPKNPKAYYRRAMAIITPPSAGATEYEQGIKELQKAYEADRSDPVIRKLLRELKEDQAKQKKRDKETFTGMFNRGQIVDEAALQESKQKAQKEPQDDSEESDGPLTDSQFDQRIREAEIAIKLFEDKGEVEKADDLRDKIKQAKEVRGRKGRKLDFRNPSPEMIKDAEKNGIDLKDPRVLKMLQDLQEEKEMELRGEKPKPRSADPSEFVAPGSTDNSVEDIVNSMTKSQLLKVARGEGVNCDEEMTEKELREVATNILRKKMAKKDVSNRTWYAGMAVIGFWTLYRMHSLGLLSGFYAMFWPFHTARGENDNEGDMLEDFDDFDEL